MRPVFCSLTKSSQEANSGYAGKGWCKMFPPKTVGIIGNVGKMAVNVVEPLFVEAGYEVIGSDIKNPSGLSSKTVAERSDVVYFSIAPICNVAAEIAELIPHAKHGALWLHGTSIQNPRRGPITQVLLSPILAERKVDVGFLHFMVGPMVKSLRGQSVVYGFCRPPTNPEWKKWLIELLQRKNPFLLERTPEFHDELTAGSQVIPQIAAVVIGQLWRKQKFSLSEVLRTAGPPCWLQSYGILRNLSQSAIIANIIANHPKAQKIVEEAIVILQTMKESLVGEGEKLIAEMALDSLKAVSEDELNAIKRSIDWHVRLEGDMRGGAVYCIFQSVENKMGLLTRVLQIFDEQGLDKTSCMAQETPGGGCTFYIGVKADINGPQVSRVCRKITADLGGNASVMR